MDGGVVIFQISRRNKETKYFFAHIIGEDDQIMSFIQAE